MSQYSSAIDYHGATIDDIREAFVLRATGGNPQDATKPYLQRELAGRTYVQLCADTLRLRGHEVPESDAGVIEYCSRYASGGDGVADIVNAGDNPSVFTGFIGERDTTWGWTSDVAVDNFKAAQTFVMSEGGRLEVLPPGGTAKDADIVLTVETWYVKRYAVKFVVDEQDMIDDQRMRAFDLFKRQLGAQARRVRSDLVYALLLRNPQLAADSTALFHTNHNNLSTAALAEGSLEAFIAAIGNQYVPDRLGRPVHLNAWPYAIIVPPDLAGEARKLVRNISLGDGDDLKVLSESRIGATSVIDPATGEAQTGSVTNWFGVCKNTTFPTIVVGHLKGRLAPQVRSYPLTGSGQWGRGYDVVYDIGVGVASYRGIYYSDGTV